MGQEEILKLLARRGWISSSDIAEELKGLNISSLGDSLRRLIKGKFIISKKCPDFKHGYLYHINDGDIDDKNL
jgi:predicted transcriptional regulator